ncbi:hypothetical protein RFI_37987, partial [Reticulomyxa filosa]
SIKEIATNGFRYERGCKNGLANNGKRLSIDLSRKDRKRGLSEVEDDSITGTMNKKMRYSELNAISVQNKQEKKKEEISEKNIWKQERNFSARIFQHWKDIGNDDQSKYIFNDLEDGICAFPKIIGIQDNKLESIYIDVKNKLSKRRNKINRKMKIRRLKSSN